MSEYSRAIKAAAKPDELRVRTDYRCAAHGCPNAGACYEVSGAGPGLCYYHWSERDNPKKWGAITVMVRAGFERDITDGGTANWRKAPELDDRGDVQADPARLKAAVARIAALRDQDPKEWARRLQHREEMGDRLTKAQRDMWRAALGRGAPESPEA